MSRLFTVIFTLSALAAGAEEATLEDTGQRFRWGISAGIGSSVGRGGVTVLGELRLGYQHSRLFNVFGTVGGGAGSLGGELDFSAVAEFTPVDWFYFGGGLAASYGTMTVVLSDSPFAYYQDPLTSFRPAIDLRFGFSTGSSRPPFFSRGGFNIGVHALLMLHPNMTLYSSTLTGGQSFSSYPAQVTFTPMLTLGFDSR